MDPSFFHLAFISPGGPEILVVMLVLLLMFGAKDAPRILRKLNEIIGQIRNSADGFKREVMYSDLTSDASAGEPDDYEGYDEAFHESELDSDAEFDEDFHEPEPEAQADKDFQEPEPETEPEAPSEEEDDVGKS